ncbi:unnamed protein product [Closterium sp. NIES-53]
MVGYCRTNDEQYTLTFVDAGTRYVWVVDLEARNRAYKAFRLWLAHAHRQSGEKLKIWQSDGAAEFHSKEIHQQQGVVERTNRTLMTKRHGIDFDQTFAPVSRHTSVRILLAIAAARHLPLRKIDVKNAFLYALVDPMIYAPRLWQQYLHNILLEIDFKKLPHDPEMYRRDFRGEYILLTVYVDDLLYTGSSNELLEEFEKNLAGRVDITCNHDVKQFLGLNISYSPKAVHLSAAKYAEELGKRFNIAPALLSTPYRTPGPNHKPDNKALSPAGLQTYQQQLGCLLFASVTCRPDLSYIASQLAQYSRKPTAENLLDLQRALQFFISAPSIGLCYSAVTSSSFNLTGYVDPDHAAEPNNRRSRTVFLFLLEPNGPISWNPQK